MKPFRFDAFSDKQTEVWALAFSGFPAAGQPADRERAMQLGDRRGPHYLAARIAAGAAFEALGLQIPDAISSGPEREAIFPKNVRASLSHTHGLAVAVVTIENEITGIGIDVESATRLVDPGVARIIRHEKDADLPLLELMSAKECIYKAYFYARGKKLGFQDAFVVRNEDSTLCGTILEDEVIQVSSLLTDLNANTSDNLMGPRAEDLYRITIGALLEGG